MPTLIQVESERMRALVDAARIGRLATVRPGGRPHVVPLCFALAGDTVYTAIDDKPKRSRRLRRLTNLEANPSCSLLVDRYDDDWSQLWWVRLDGRGRTVTEQGETERALRALADKYRQYADQAPGGPIIAIEVDRWTGWSAT